MSNNKRHKLGVVILFISILSWILLAGVLQKRRIEMLPDSKEEMQQEVSNHAELEIDISAQADSDVAINKQKESERINYKTTVATTIIPEEDLIEIEIEMIL